MMTNNQVFLLTKNRKLGEKCYELLNRYDHSLDVVLYLDLEKSLSPLKSKKANLVLVDNKIFETPFKIKFETLNLQKEQFIVIKDNIFEDKASDAYSELETRLETYFKIDEISLSSETIKTPNILGIGASTGGPTALLDLFADLNPNLLFPIVIVNHIPPGDFAQNLAASLTYNSKIKVSLAQNGMILKKGHAYLSPGGKHLTVQKIKGKMQYIAVLNDDPPLNSCKPSIDLMFRSLSELKFTRVAAMVLTGMGSDGTKGAESIIKNNGCVYSQDPKECLIKSMPESVIKSDFYSKSLKINELAYHINKKIFTFKSKTRSKQISEIINVHKEIPQEVNKETKPKAKSGIKKAEITNDILLKFKRLLESEASNTGRTETTSTLRRKLESLLLKFSVDTYAELHEIALAKTRVRQAVVDCLTNHETFFFRDNYPYEFIKNVFLPEKRKNKQSFKVWSAACSTGQEPYSIAMTIANSADGKSLPRFKIVASDVSRASVSNAARGMFNSQEVGRGLQQSHHKFFSKTGSSYTVSDKIKRFMDFRHINLDRIPSELPYFDLIFLRYVLIYFDDAKKQKTLDSIVEKMNPGAYLILDPATALKVRNPQLKPLRYKSQSIFLKQG